MKKISYALLVILFTFSVSSCSTSTAADNNKKDDKKTDVSSDKVQSGSINLTRAEFLSKVYNYEKNTESWVYEGDKPAIVDFYADWCQPCKIASPILDELAEEYEGKIYVYKVDTEKEKELAAAFGIRSIPTFLLIPMGEMPQMFSGIGQTKEATKEIFVQAIDELLLKSKE
ncbi:MAG: thioredoxin [Bacteroidales bacterium]|nr:thioredoxin [Bacteroidales bacterium]